MIVKEFTTEAMLRQLTVRNYVVLERLELELGAGLTVLTGESGAGKSMVLGALALALGARASSELVRPGTERAEVNLELEVSAVPAAAEVLKAQALDDPDAPERCLIRRTVAADGRSRAFVNGSPVTLQVLRALTAPLADIHGQGDHNQLSSRDAQLALLDEFAGLTGQASQLRDHFRQWRHNLERKQALTDELAAQEDRAALLSYQVQELEDADLRHGEFKDLSAEQRRLSQAEVIQGLLAQVGDAIAENPLVSLQRHLDGIDDEHPKLQAARDLLRSALTELDEAGAELRAYGDAVESDDARLHAVEERMSLLHELGRKHQIAPEALAAHAAGLGEELAALSQHRAALDGLDDAIAAARSAFEKAARKLSNQRRKAADRFATEVTQRLRELGIREGSLAVAFEDAEWEQGLERVTYMITTNPNFPAGPLTSVASGGEQARIALAIQVVAAETSRMPSLILDEADVGVGGTTADVVGRVLRALAEHRQVICISHAPQVAALADTHLRIVKSAEYQTCVEPLDTNARVEELARMLAGAELTEKSRAYASTLLKEAAR